MGAPVKDITKYGAGSGKAEKDGGCKTDQSGSKAVKADESGDA